MIELNVGIICSCIPHIACFFRQRRSATSYIRSLKKLRSKFWRNHGSGTEKLNDVESPALSNPRLRTEILGTIQGEGKFMETGVVIKTEALHQSQDLEVDERVGTKQQQLER